MTDLVLELKLCFKNLGVPFSGNIEITATPEGGNWDLVKGHCKRITFSYLFPKRARYYVAHIAMNAAHDRKKYVTWCGIFVTKVKQLSWGTFGMGRIPEKLDCLEHLNF